jgi:hypothetical protein
MGDAQRAGIIIAASLLFFGVGGVRLWLGKTWFKSGKVITRDEDPKRFWIDVCMLFAAGAFGIGMALATLLGNSR